MAALSIARPARFRSAPPLLATGDDRAFVARALAIVAGGLAMPERAANSLKKAGPACESEAGPDWGEARSTERSANWKLSTKPWSACATFAGQDRQRNRQRMRLQVCVRLIDPGLHHHATPLPLRRFLSFGKRRDCGKRKGKSAAAKSIEVALWRYRDQATQAKKVVACRKCDGRLVRAWTPRGVSPRFQSQPVRAQWPSWSCFG